MSQAAICRRDIQRKLLEYLISVSLNFAEVSAGNKWTMPLGHPR